MKIKNYTPNKIKTGNPFVDLFPIHTDDYNRLYKNMKENGFDDNKPILMWEEENILIDGHTRLEACKKLDLSSIPVNLLSFENEYEAIKYAAKENSDKGRILTNWERLKLLSILDNPKSQGGDRNPKGKNQYNGGQNLNLSFDHNDEESKESAKETAIIMGISSSSINKMRTVSKYADEETLEDIENDEISIDKAWKKAKKRKKEIEAELKAKKQFNSTNDNIDWAKWSWNPITGCKHDCKYCYARDIANRFYEHGFEPTFHPERLTAPENTKIPKNRENEPGIKNVFLVSMGDMLGDWVADEWIEKILDAVENNDQWNYLILTKNPGRYLEFKWPENCLLGVTTDTQKRLDKAVEVFSKIEEENIKFISCEPLKTEIKIPENSNIDWVIIGGQSKTSKVPEYQPEWDWIESLMCQCKYFDIPYYWKPNLKTRPKMYPKNLKI